MDDTSFDSSPAALPEQAEEMQGLACGVENASPVAERIEETQGLECDDELSEQTLEDADGDGDDDDPPFVPPDTDSWQNEREIGQGYARPVESQAEPAVEEQGLTSEPYPFPDPLESTQEHENDKDKSTSIPPWYLGGRGR